MNEETIKQKIYELARQPNASAIIYMGAARLRSGAGDATETLCDLLQAMEQNIQHVTLLAQKVMQNRPAAPIVLQVTQEQADEIVRTIPGKD